MRPRYSLLAVASVVLNMPWLIALGNVVRVYAAATGPVAGEGWLLPLMAWGVSFPLAGSAGIAAIALIRGSRGRLRGQWIALLGLGITSIVPVFGIVYF